MLAGERVSKLSLLITSDRKQLLDIKYIIIYSVKMVRLVDEVVSVKDKFHLHSSVRETLLEISDLDSGVMDMLR